MKKATIHLKSVSPITFGKFHQTEKLPKELADAYEARTWREKLHYNKNENVFIPGIMICNCIRESAKFLSLPVPGKGKSTFTKHFTSIMPVSIEGIVMSIKKNDVGASVQHVPSDGMVGGTKRVIKYFPIVPEWEGKTDILIPDDIVTPDIFESIVQNAGQLIGLGTWRPRNRGMNGRFELIDMKWTDS